MGRSVRRLPIHATALALVSVLTCAGALAQREAAPPARKGSARAASDSLPVALVQMVDAEQAFAARALVVGWKQAFLEFFAHDAVGFADGAAGFAHDQIRSNPDPPRDHQLLWEPRWGDVAASGELGYLTGPARSVLPSRDKGRPRHSTYASIWKRQRDGSFKVVLDVGVDTPGPVSFPPAFTRASIANRFTGDYDESTPPLAAADGVLNSGLRSSPSRAYRGRLANGARLHRPNMMPLVGEQSILRHQASQPALSASDTRYTEAARSGDLGFTWGTYQVGRRGRTPAREGFYVRVWVRERNGQWKVALDVLQPQ
jgi:ketosteroid isomerase-like protein